MEELVMETINLGKRFGKHRAVESLDVKVEKGSVYGLLGPNGAGKTTLLKLLVGLLRPTNGQVFLFGEPWKRECLQKVGALIETPSLYGHLTGTENLQVHTRLLGLPKMRISEVLEQVELRDVDRKKVSAYSLGMKQRLGIASALLGDPELLILDEPTNGLDPMGIRQMRALIHSFSEQGTTVIVSSHILSEVAQIVSHVGIIGGGELRYQGSIDELMGHGRSYLELHTNHNESALRLLGEHFSGATVEDGSLLVPAAENEMAEVLSSLHESGIQVEKIDYHRDDLESLFMHLVEQGSPEEGGKQ